METRYEIAKQQRVIVRAAIRALGLPGVTVEESDCGYIRVESHGQLSLLPMSYGYRDEFTLRADRFRARAGQYPLRDGQYNLPGILRTVRTLVEMSHGGNQARAACLVREEMRERNYEASVALLHSTASANGWTVGVALGEPQVYIKGLRITGSHAHADRLHVDWMGKMLEEARPETLPAFIAALDNFLKINEV
jgi:hypothetical protein